MESNGDLESKSHYIRTILTYLTEHPHAQDTVEGIVEWWILRQKIKQKTAAVQAALAELVARGLVVERQGRGARPSYSVNQQRRDEIRSLLEK